MPTLHEVCVWTMPFPPDGVNVDTTGSPNVFFTNECSSSTNAKEDSLFGLSFDPNPTNGSITIETDISTQYILEIISLNGQLLFSKEIEGSNYQIDLSSFKKGVYMISIKSNDFVATLKTRAVSLNGKPSVTAGLLMQYSRILMKFLHK